MSDENKALVHRFYEEVFNQKNIQAIDDICAPSMIDHSPMPGQEPGLQGMKDSFTVFVGGFPDLKATVEAMVAEGDLVATRFTVTATHTGEVMGARPTGRPVTFHGIDILRISAGKVTEAWHQGDEMLVMAELGATP